ncbi:MAG: hypothetical protein H7840_15810 [Alphaproteobacteria bacterium]
MSLMIILAGMLAGWAFFAALALEVRLSFKARSGFVRGALRIGRLGLVGGLGVLAARQGALPLLWGLGGFLVARTVAVRIAAP